MALKCYPLQPGGLLALEAVAIGMTHPEHVKAEIIANFEVILLLIFMVAGIYFMKRLLLFVFTKLLLSIRSKMVLSLAFLFKCGLFYRLFLDALTVVAVIISVGMGFYGVYHKVASGNNFNDSTDITKDDKIGENKDTLEQFRAFLRSLMMHSCVGTALGGVMTMVGEPQNLIIAEQAKWAFGEFFL
ncbi:sodium/proton antiporter, partial [Pasteurella multocida subsp. multocida str. Anand1_cattle]